MAFQASRSLFLSAFLLYAAFVCADVPATPSSPDPADGSQFVSETVFLKWKATGATDYVVSFGTTDHPAGVGNVSDATFGESDLTRCTTYHWRVTARNAEGSTEGPVWSFRVGGRCPEAELNDKNEKFQLVGGVEESGLSSQGVSTNAFLQAFTESPGDSRLLSLWGRIRLLGAPQQGSSGIISTALSPTGELQKQDITKVGQAVDLAIGLKLANWPALKIGTSGAYSINPIVGVGFTTPLNSQDVVVRYQMPDFGTVECQALQSPDRFGNDFARLKVTAGAVTPSTMNPSCLVGPDGKTAIAQLALSNQDRSNFYGKWGVGIRTTTRFKTSDDDPQRGIVDFVVGQDATLTGGSMKRFVLKIDAVHPLPIKDNKYLYLFGSAGIRFKKSTNLDPLILKTLDATTTTTIPSSSVLVLPLRQSNRDFYRIGIGLDLKELFTKLFE